MLLFFVPQNFPEMAQYVYIFLMYNIVNAVCLTGMLVPYYSMISLMTAKTFDIAKIVAMIPAFSPTVLVK